MLGNRPDSQAPAGHVAHAEEQRPGVLAHFIDGDDVGVFQAGDGLGLGPEPGPACGIRELVDTYPADLYWTKAYFQIAFLQAYPQDVETFTAFVAAAPDAPEAPDALFRAARLRERNDDLAEAAALWTRIANEYPAAEQAADAAMQAGLVFYRTGDESSAALRFEQASELAGG